MSDVNKMLLDASLVELTRERKVNAILLRALRAYAKEKNWCRSEEDWHEHVWLPDEHGYKRAQEALKKIREVREK